eukprot:SM000023S07687  [mRNA]  locus=s23:808234:810144:- [translate_table: standard]
MGNPLSKPAETVGRAITDSGHQLNETASRAAGEAVCSLSLISIRGICGSNKGNHGTYGYCGQCPFQCSHSFENAANSAQVVCTKAGDASDAIKKLANTTASFVGELKPRFITTLDQASSTLGTFQDSVNQITPQAASTLETVQMSVQNLTPTAQNALHSLSTTSEAVGQSIPALMQTCQVAAVSGVASAAALGSTPLSLNTIATRGVPAIEAILVIQAADSVPTKASGFLKALKDDQHGVFIPATNDAYLMCCNDFTKEDQECHLAETLEDAVKKVMAMRWSGVLQEDIEVVYHRDIISATIDKDIIVMPEGMGRFIMEHSGLQLEAYLEVPRKQFL